MEINMRKENKFWINNYMFTCFNLFYTEYIIVWVYVSFLFGKRQLKQVRNNKNWNNTLWHYRKSFQWTKWKKNTMFSRDKNTPLSYISILRTNTNLQDVWFSLLKVEVTLTFLFLVICFRKLQICLPWGFIQILQRLILPCNKCIAQGYLSQ